jgi:DNA-binding response OmpR family regulator
MDLRWISILNDKTTILIVEDELIPAECLKELLEAQNHTVLEVIDNAPDAISFARQHHPDIVLMDIMLKGPISGCEAAVEIFKTTHSAIIFLSANVDDEMLQYAADSNAYGYLLKPYNDKEILTTLALTIAKHKNVIRPSAKKHIIELNFGFSFDTQRVQLIHESRDISAGPRIQKLLEILVKNIDNSVSKEQIMFHVWGEEVNEKTLRSLIHRTRTLLDIDLIENISSKGYLICSKEK